MVTKQKNIGIILMTYGSPKTLADVPQYLKNVYGGKDASGDVIAKFQRRYGLIGGSPLVQITQDQAKALEKELAKQYPDGPTFHVRAGMRFSDPFIREVVREFPKDTDQIIGIVMSPQYSPIIMSGYQKELQQAVSQLQKKNVTLTLVEDWHREPYIIQAFAKKVEKALETFPAAKRETIPVLFSAHSMPKRIIEKEQHYITALKETAAAVAKDAGLASDRWQFCYQSAGHTPEEWLKPDFEEIMPQLKAAGQKNVLIAPVQFLADHLEILYDVGIAAREQAEKYGITFAYTESLNTSPLFIKGLVAIVGKQL